MNNIEQMKQTVSKAIDDMYQEGGSNIVGYIATVLDKAGYRKQSETVEEFAKLKAENERLTKHLENYVQLPCKVGGVIYWVTKGNDFECREFYYIDEGIVEWVMVEEDGTYWVYVKYNSGLTYQHHIEKTTQEDNLYQSLSEAEARLKELQKED